MTPPAILILQRVFSWHTTICMAVMVFLCDSSAISLARDSTRADKQYVCPPCPVECHDVTFDKPGRCPKCNMRLIEVERIRNVAILVWDGVELLDFAGPGEVFAAAQVGEDAAFKVFTVAPTPSQVTSQGFLKITPNYSIDNCPEPQILIIPGGNSGELTRNKKLVDWVRETSNKTEMVLSVCTGAFVLAEAGLLDDIEATTWHGAIDDLRRRAPRTKVHADRRFVDSGDIITAAGVSAGIDGALHALSRLTGPDVAAKTARYMEYNWQPSDSPDRRSADGVGTAPRADGPRTSTSNSLAALEAKLRSGSLTAEAALADAGFAGLHERRDFRDLIREYSRSHKATLTLADEPGTPMQVSGVVRDSANRPVANALLYVYHTNSQGSYSSTGGNTGSMGDSLNPRLFAYLRTDSQGRYEYHTIRPGQYPGNGPPAHVHYEVTADGHPELVTELMFEGDSRLTSHGLREFQRAGFLIRPVSRDANGGEKVTCDIRLPGR